MLWKTIRKYLLRIFSPPLFFLFIFPSALWGLPDFVEVGMSKSTILNVEVPLEKVSIPQPEIADVIVISPWQILINGKALGETSLILWGRDNSVDILNLKVHSNRDYKLIMLEVRFAEVDRTALKELGFDLLVFGQDVHVGSWQQNITAFEMDQGGIDIDFAYKATLFL
ncbi:MAG: hypothetical protein A2Z06_01750 [Candidatus Glassbacteria bacterium RBG_16_58_8]|uniref:Pilus formation protein N-terminal domain-containing protein n=1 Tax=Candidatus Glassbacteria bacterium RBG_16_58_8 TaxID=1817866 RepID=A0A1F5YD71_9BACT|nr:MAG: hypothetical protein A2Z06_01750 [Candidatus Glassbacteria bacterium RBG_16_58_8]